MKLLYGLLYLITGLLAEDAAAVAPSETPTTGTKGPRPDLVAGEPAAAPADPAPVEEAAGAEEEHGTGFFDDEKLLYVVYVLAAICGLVLLTVIVQLLANLICKPKAEKGDDLQMAQQAVVEEIVVEEIVVEQSPSSSD